MDKQKNKIDINKVLFSKRLNNINLIFLKNWCLNFFQVKNLLIRIFSFILVLILSNVLFFVLRKNALENFYSQPIFNTGAGFSFGSDWPIWSIYFIKSIFSMLFLVLSFIFNKWYVYIPFFVISVNSWLNIIDKLVVDDYMGVKYYHAVVDYFYWNIGFTNNIADTLIVSFFIVLVLVLIVETIKTINKKDDKGQNDEKNIS